MDKKQIKYLAVMGLLSGLLTTSANAADVKISSQDSKPANQSYDDEEMTESELLEQLDGEGKKLYNSLDDQGKKLALQVANQKCQGFNACKGLNVCKTAKHSCKFQASCKGQSDCAFTNKNDAVKAVHNKLMAEKRQKVAH